MRKYIYTILLTIVSLAITSCGDEAGEITATSVPRMTTVTPEDGATNVIAQDGSLTIELVYDQKIKLTEDNPLEKIQVFRGELEIVDVYCANNILYIELDKCNDKTNYEIYIPKGVILSAADGTEAYAARFSFTVKLKKTAPFQLIKTNLCNENASPEAKRLYTELVRNYGKNIISGAMAIDQVQKSQYHSWNSEYAEFVGQKIGKTPLLNGFDYGHLSSSPANWIDYNDITPVTDWYHAGGIVSAMWHWNVPDKEPLHDAVNLFYGQHDLENWNSREVSLNGNDVNNFTKIKFSISDVKDDAQILIQKKDNGGGDISSVMISSDMTEYVLELNDEIKTLIGNEFVLNGKNCTVTSIDMIDYTLGFYVPGAGSSSTTFDPSKVLEENSWQHKFFYDDLKKLADYMKPISDAGIPVIWRPLHEASGGWFWWAAGGPEVYKQLWQMMYKYLIGERELNNLIWVWTSDSKGNDEEWFPGNDYVDIIGRDLYDVSDVDEFVNEFYNLSEKYPNMMIALTECGRISNISDIWEAGAKWAWFMPWYPSSIDNWEEQATEAWWNDAANTDYVKWRN